MDDFAPDSIANLLVELDDGHLLEFYDDGKYELRNEIDAILEQGTFRYNKIDGTNAELELNNRINPNVERLNVNFIDAIMGYYKWNIIEYHSWNTMPHLSGRFEIISHKQKGPTSFEEALDYVFDIGKRSKKNLSPQSLPQGIYRFFIRTQEKPVKKGILFFITIKENGQYNFEQRHKNPPPPHTSHYRYSKTGAQKAELILDGFDKETFYLTYQNTDAGIFMKKSASSDRIYEGIFLKE